MGEVPKLASLPDVSGGDGMETGTSSGDAIIGQPGIGKFNSSTMLNGGRVGSSDAAVGGDSLVPWAASIGADPTRKSCRDSMTCSSGDVLREARCSSVSIAETGVRDNVEISLIWPRAGAA